MATTKKNITLFAVIGLFTFFYIVSTTSCSSLKPITQNDSVQTLAYNDISKFDGDYEIFSNDTSNTTLAYALTYSNKDYFNHFVEKDYTINLTSIDSRHLKVTVFSKGSAIKIKIIKGQLYQNYFQFTLRNISSIPPFYIILNRYRRQKNRIGLQKNGDLILDTNEGGVILLVIMPTFGTGVELGNLKFKRKRSSSQQ